MDSDLIERSCLFMHSCNEQAQTFMQDPITVTQSAHGQKLLPNAVFSEVTSFA